jgi:hypothetical protein
MKVRLDHHPNSWGQFQKSIKNVPNHQPAMVFSWFCVKCPSSGWLFPHHFLPTPAGHDQFFQVTGGENAPPDPGTTDAKKGISIGALRLGGSKPCTPGEHQNSW